MIHCGQVRTALYELVEWQKKYGTLSELADLNALITQSIQEHKS
jgi:hypothetical protein